MLSQLGPSHIIFIMQLTTYLISILVLVLEGAGYHCHPAQSFKFFSVINSTVVSIFLYPTKPLSSHSPTTLLPPPHNWGQTHLTILYICHTPISPFLISTSTEPQTSSLVSPMFTFILLNLCSIVCRFSINWSHRWGDHALV